MKNLYLILALLIMTSCTTRHTNMGLIVPQETKFTFADINEAKVIKGVHGSDSKPIFLFIPLGQPSFEKALNNTLKAGKGNVLINAKIANSTNWFILFGYNKVEITGDVVNIVNY